MKRSFDWLYSLLTSVCEYHNGMCHTEMTNHWLLRTTVIHGHVILVNRFQALWSLENGLKRPQNHNVLYTQACILTYAYIFYVLLTVHLGIILVNNQLDAQFFFLIRLFKFATCFEQHSAHHQDQFYQYKFWYLSHLIDDRLVSICTPDGHLQGVTYTRSCIDAIDSLDYEHCAARNMQRIEINI